MRLAQNLLVTSLFCLLAASAQAQVTVSLTPSTLQPITPGGTITFSGTLTNTGAADTFINGDQILISPPDKFIFDDTPLLTAGPLFPLTAGSSFTGTLFSLTAPSGLLHSDYSGSLTLLGGPDVFTTDPVGAAAFRFRAVPEPGPIALLAGGGVTAFGFLVRRRKR